MRQVIALITLCFGVTAFGANLDLRNKNYFNPDCSYRVHMAENGITSQVSLVSEEKIAFDTVVGFGPDGLESTVRMTIYADNKDSALMMGFAEIYQGYQDPNPYIKILGKGSYITEHSCSKK